MFETLFGAEMPLAARFFIAFLVVLALIGATAWLVRRFGANRLGGAGVRGRQPRLAVIDAATVDQRRRLVLVRRDNIEHLLLIGGPTDLVVEPNIVRAVGSREVTREPGRLSTTIEPTARAAGGLESSWPLQPSSEPTPVPAPRPYRSPAVEEPWHAPEPGARSRPADSLTGQSLTGLAAELSSRLNPPDAAPAPRIESAPRVSAAAPAMTTEPVAPPQNDHNLAEMAQQLEAALRRTPDNRPPVTDPQALPPRAPARDFKPRVEPRFDAKFDSKFDAKFDAKPEPRLDSAAPAGKKLYENLEEEMASLLGRPSGKP
ncbi:MAG TPA: flagellar biosynthetic protein FliO [Pseudolabrys sp.]